MDEKLNMPELQPFLDPEGRLTALPTKYRKKLYAFYYLATKFEPGRQYTEPEINELLDGWTDFHDPATLRRELYNRYLLNRTEDGRLYWTDEKLPTLEAFLAKYL